MSDDEKSRPSCKFNSGKWIAISVAIVALGIATWALVLVNSTIDVQELAFSYDKLGTIVGIYVTIVGVVFSLYFVVIGLDVKQQKKEIDASFEDFRNGISSMKTEFANLKKELGDLNVENRDKLSNLDDKIKQAESFLKLSDRSIIVYYETMIGVFRDYANKRSQKDILKSFVAPLQLERARVVCQAEFFPWDERIQGIEEMGNYSNTKKEIEDSLNILKLIISGIKDQDEKMERVKENVNKVKKELEKKLDNLK